MSSATRRAIRKRMADRKKTWNVHIGGMVFPFPSQAEAQYFVDSVIDEHPTERYTIEHEDLTDSPIMEVETTSGN